MSTSHYDTIGTETTINQFWRLAQEPKLIYNYNVAFIRRTIEAAQIKFEHKSKVLDIACGKQQYMVNHLWQTAGLRVGLDFYLPWLNVNQDVDVRICADMYYCHFKAMFSTRSCR